MMVEPLDCGVPGGHKQVGNPGQSWSGLTVSSRRVGVPRMSRPCLDFELVATLRQTVVTYRGLRWRS